MCIPVRVWLKLILCVMCSLCAARVVEAAEVSYCVHVFMFHLKELFFIDYN